MYKKSRKLFEKISMLIDAMNQELQGYLERLKTYAHHMEVCGDERNSDFKTDHDAAFMRIKRDYMGNDQLLPAYNLQTAVCDEYIAVVDIKPYASDMEWKSI